MQGFWRVYLAIVGVLVALLGAALATAAVRGDASGPQIASGASPTGAEQYPPRRVLICHRTRSRKRPIVTIRVPRRAVPAHLRHGDKRGRCPRGRKVTICHKTKSKKRPFVTLRLTRRQLGRHVNHRRDKLGACPKRRKR
jgi:hypothetical protein